MSDGAPSPNGRRPCLSWLLRPSAAPPSIPVAGILAHDDGAPPPHPGCRTAEGLGSRTQVAALSVSTVTTLIPRRLFSLGGRAPRGCPGACLPCFSLSLCGCVSQRAGQSVAAVEISRGSSGSASGFRISRCGLLDSA
jgi:hypothetical protein